VEKSIEEFIAGESKELGLIRCKFLLCFMQYLVFIYIRVKYMNDHRTCQHVSIWSSDLEKCKSWSLDLLMYVNLAILLSKL
jgi:hypothetical protein